MTATKIKDINEKMMYRHKMSIERECIGVNKDLSVSTGWELKHEEIPCLLSKKEPDTAKNADDVNLLVEGFRLFCGPEVDLEAGDLVGIDGKKYLAGEPLRYPEHMETLLTRKDMA